jgi:hypothetical protein
VPKSGSLGSARGALSNGRPYREHLPHRLGASYQSPRKTASMLLPSGSSTNAA